MSVAISLPLEEIMASRSGSVDPSQYPDELFDLYSVPAYDSGQPEVIVGRKIGSAKQVVRPGDVLLSRIVPHIRRTWVVGRNRGRRMIASGEWIVFRSHKFHPSYLRHVLRGDSFHSHFMQTVSGVGGSLLRARPAQVGEIEISLPSLPDQQRIARILDQGDWLGRIRRYALDLNDNFLQSIFREMFGDPEQNPKGWDYELVENICDLVRGSSPRPQGDPRYFGGPIPRLMIEDITRDGIYVTPSVDSLTVEGAKRSRSMPSSSVVMAVSGAVGLPAILSCDACIHDGFVGFRDLGSQLIPIYFYFVLKCMQARNKLKAPGAIWKNLTTDQVSDWEIPVPPIEIQRKFQLIASQIQRLMVRQREARCQAEHLFQTLLHRAFCREL